MLTVGVDSYVTLEEAEQLAMLSFISSDTAYEKWRSLSDSDKEVLLRNSCSAIDSLNFDGRRQKLGQILEFPRVNTSVSGIGYRLFIGQLYDNGLYSGNSTGGLSAAQKAQVINAVYAGYYNDETTELIGVSIQGLTSKKAGPIAESYNRDRRDTEDALIGIYTKKVDSLLKPWLNDSRISYYPRGYANGFPSIVTSGVNNRISRSVLFAPF